MNYRIPWRRERLPTPEFWPGEFHGQRSLASYSPWGRKESGPTEWLSKAQQGLRQDFPGGSVIKNPPTNAGDKEVWVQFLGREDPLE